MALEAAWQRGPLSLQGELFQSFVGADAGGSLRFGGAYVQASWVATGESRPYDRAQAVFGRVAPREDFAPLRGRWGALELAGRVSWLDLADGPVDGGRLYGVGLGVTWTWNRFVRIQAGYGFSHTQGGPEAGGAGAHPPGAPRAANLKSCGAKNGSPGGKAVTRQEDRVKVRR